jgi:SAM-dependent methyltransferase
MDLDQAMLAIGQRLRKAVAADQLTEGVRAGLLALWSGSDPAGLPSEEASAISAWMRRAYGDSSDPAGAIYQEALHRVMSAGDDGALRVQVTAEGHRASGAYYTRDTVVRYMLSRATRYMPGARAVIDPACGSGVFLREARRVYDWPLRLVGLDSDPSGLQLANANAPGAELHAVDALLDEVPGGFDLCLGNPPYISSGLRGAVAHDPQRLESLRRRFSATAEYKINTYPLFIERGLELLQDGGVLGFIVPDSFLSGRYFAGTRRLLLSHTLLELTLIREDFWQHGRVGQSVILFVRKGPAPTAHRVKMQVCDRVAGLSETGLQATEPADLVWGALQRFRLIPDARERRFVRAMEAVPGRTQLGDLVSTYSGLIGKHGQRSLLRSDNPQLTGPWGSLLRSGKEIDRYRLQWAGEQVCLDPALIKSGGHLAYYQQPKLLLRQTADRLQAVYDDQGYYCLNNIHLLVSRDSRTDLRFLLALINSGPVNRYYRALTMEAGRLYPQVDLDLLESIPVPDIAPEPAARLSGLAWRRESAAPVEAALIEQEVDEAVSRLYGLLTGP